MKISERIDLEVQTRFTWEGGDAIRSHTTISVGVDPPMPFSAFPKRLLRGTGNAVLRASLSALHKSFIQSLGKGAHPADPLAPLPSRSMAAPPFSPSPYISPSRGGACLRRPLAHMLLATRESCTWELSAALWQSSHPLPFPTPRRRL